MCASSCIKQYVHAAFIWMPWDARSCRYVFILREKIILYVQPSYGCRGMPVVAGMCLYCVKKLFITFKKVLEQERKTFTNMKHVCCNCECLYQRKSVTKVKL